MAKTRAAALAVAIAIIGLSSCTTLTTPAVNSADISSVDFSQSFVRGESCRVTFLGIFGPFGDASVVQAAQNANIATVEIVDYKLSIGLFSIQYCVVVYGR